MVKASPLIKLLAACLSALALEASAADDLGIARAALRDRLYDVAETHAARLLAGSPGEADGRAALEILLESLFQQDRAQEVLTDLNRYGTLASPPVFDYWRAQALLKLGRPGEAARTASEAIPKARGDTADALRRVLARALLRTGDSGAAFALYGEINRLSTNAMTRADNALEWAAAIEQAGRRESALEVLKIQASIGVRTRSVDEGRLMRARLLASDKNPDHAAEGLALYKALAADEHAGETARIPALIALGDRAWAAGDTNRAIACAREALNRASLPAMRRFAGFRLGSLLMASRATLDEGERIIKGLVRDYPDEPESSTAYLALADALLAAGENARAVEAYRNFKEAYPKLGGGDRVMEGSGWALFRLGRYMEAGEVFRRLASQSTNAGVRAEASFKEADSLLADGRFVEASRAYRRTAALPGSEALAGRAAYQAAECLERAGRIGEAASNYLAVAGSYPADEVAPRSLMRVAAIQAGTNAFEAAIATYSRILGRYPAAAIRVESLMGRGKLAYRLYHFDAAMQDFASLAEVDKSRRDEARFLITLCLYGLGREKEARAAATAFLLEFPESPRLPDMMLWLGKLDFNRGRYADARKVFLDYVSRWPRQRAADAALLWAARAAAGQGDYTGVIALATRFVKEYPSSPRLTEARLVQANALIDLARFSEAVLLLDQVLAEAPAGEWTIEAKLRRADALFALGSDNTERYEKALAGYRDVLAADTLPPVASLQVRYKIARCLEKLGRRSEAIDAYYSDVIQRYQEGRARGVWYDETADGLFVKAVFNVSELYEQSGKLEQARSVLQRVLRTALPGSEEARRRLDRLGR